MQPAPHLLHSESPSRRVPISGASYSTVHKKRCAPKQNRTHPSSTQTIHCRETDPSIHHIPSVSTTVQTGKRSKNKGSRDTDLCFSCGSLLSDAFFSSPRPSHVHATRNQSKSNLNRNCFFLSVSHQFFSPISLPLTSARVDIYTPMGPPPSPQPPTPQGLCFFASWAAAWWIGGMEEGGEGGGGGGPGLRFLLQLDPGKPGFDRTLLGFSLSALFSRLLRWSKDGQRRGGGGGSMAIAAAEGGEDSGNAAVSAAALAAAASLCLAAMYASDQRPRPDRRRRLSAAALPAPSSGPRFE